MNTKFKIGTSIVLVGSLILTPVGLLGVQRENKANAQDIVIPKI